MKEFDSGDDDDERSGAEKDTGKKKEEEESETWVETKVLSCLWLDIGVWPQAICCLLRLEIPFIQQKHSPCLV